MSRNITILLTSMALLCTSLSGLAASPKWETPKTERTEVPIVARDTDITIRAAKGTVVVTTNKPVQIKVFTILGQQISNETLPAGTSQLNITTHGVFIVKTGELTCKVAL